MQFQHERKNLRFDFRHLTSRTCNVTFGLEITSGFRPWLKKGHALKFTVDRDVGGHGHVDEDSDGDDNVLVTRSITQESLFYIANGN